MDASDDKTEGQEEKLPEGRAKRTRNTVKYAERIDWDDYDWDSDEETPPPKKVKAEAMQTSTYKVREAKSCGF